jgi:hypothetical protein
MRHVILTCRHHPKLRWSCKEIAFTEAGGYNGQRNIFFSGVASGKGMFSDGSGLDCSRIDPDTGEYVEECKCPSSDLVRAPEDKLVSERYERSE